jgi:hypothetical protein
LKAVFSIFLSGVLLFTICLKSAVFIEFKINQKFIAETLCKNKDKPELKCEGKCYLKTRLARAESAPADSPDFRNIKELSPFVVQKIIKAQAVFFIHKEPTQNRMESVYIPRRSVGSVFHPPENATA